MGLQANARQVTTALSNDLWLIARQVNHRGGLQGAGACIDDTCHLALVTFADILRVIQGHCFADSDQGRCQHGSALLATTLIAIGETVPLNDAQDIRERYERQVAGVIDAGACALEPTTVIDLTGDEPEVIRHGGGDLARVGL